MLPILYISHGSPMLALDLGASGVQPRCLTAELPRPKVIPVVSTYWESDDLRVAGAAAPDIWHDPYGFPPSLYAVRYPAKGVSALAQRTTEPLQVVDLPAQVDSQQSFGYGTWVPLSLMHLQADIPVLQLSLSGHLGPVLQSRVGQVLRQLCGKGVLLIGSGSITHSLGEPGWYAGLEAIEPWVWEFRDWMVEKLQAGDEAALHDYRRQASWVVRNRPSDKHLLPLFFTRGVGGGGVCVEHSGSTLGLLGMDIYRFD